MAYISLKEKTERMFEKVTLTNTGKRIVWNYIKEVTRQSYTNGYRVGKETALVLIAKGKND